MCVCVRERESVRAHACVWASVRPGWNSAASTAQGSRILELRADVEASSSASQYGTSRTWTCESRWIRPGRYRWIRPGRYRWIRPGRYRWIRPLQMDKARPLQMGAPGPQAAARTHARTSRTWAPPPRASLRSSSRATEGCARGPPPPSSPAR